MASVLVLGVGNVLMGDDGLGVHALRALGEGDLCGADALELGTSLVDCFPELEGRRHVVALDAVEAGGLPGTLYWLDREQLIRARSGRLTLHDGDLLDALDLAGLRGYRPVLHVAGMEPFCTQNWSMELSAPVRAAFPAYLDMIRLRLRMLTGGSGSTARSTEETSSQVRGR